MLNDEFRRLAGFVESGEASLRRLLCKRNASSRVGTYASFARGDAQPKPHTGGGYKRPPEPTEFPPFPSGAGSAPPGGLEGERAAACKALQTLGLSKKAAEALLNECHSLTAAELISEALRRYRS